MTAPVNLDALEEISRKVEHSGNLMTIYPNTVILLILRLRAAEAVVAASKTLARRVSATPRGTDMLVQFDGTAFTDALASLRIDLAAYDYAVAGRQGAT